MDEYIEREAVLIYAKMLVHTAYERKEKITDDEIEKLVYGIHADFTGAELGAIPAADVVGVRHGEWVVSRTDFGWNCSEFPTHCKCTLCGREVPYQDRDNYCPNCGAKMDGGVNDAAD